jgi:hypothetical protein
MIRPEEYRGEFILADLDGYILSEGQEDTVPAPGQVLYLWQRGRYTIFRMGKSCPIMK